MRHADKHGAKAPSLEHGEFVVLVAKFLLRVIGTSDVSRSPCVHGFAMTL